jgi:hypothetical protein
MDAETISSTNNEQDWIQKYRAALDMPSGSESRMKALRATFSKVAGILSSGIRSILKTQAIAPPVSPAPKQPTKAGLVQTPTMADLKPRVVHRTAVKQSTARKRPSPQRRRRDKAS